MKVKKFQERLLEKGKKAGFKDMEVYMQKGKSVGIKIFKGEIDHYSNSTTGGVSFRGMYKGKMGYAFSEQISEEAIKLILEQAKQNALIIEEEEQEKLYKGASAYPKIKSFDADLQMIPMEEKIAAAKEMEKAAYAVDDRVQSVDHCAFGYGEGQQSIRNTKGLKVSHKENYAYAYVSARVEENGQVKTAGQYWIGTDFSTFDPKSLGEEAAREALSYLGAESISSGKYPILLRNDAAATLLQTYIGIFFATQVQKGFSLLQGKLGEVIASEKITLRDDALYEGGISSTPFDSEGVATRNKVVVENGVLSTFLHNRKTAKKDGIKSTGNGFKGSYKSSVEVAATNFYVVPGASSMDEMMEQMYSGLLITDLAGLHSGTNTVSGDFSLAASGYLIEEGKIQRSVDQITIAGNFFELLKEVVEVGSDFRFHMPSSSGTVGSPTLYIKELAVAGI